MSMVDFLKKFLLKNKYKKEWPKDQSEVKDVQYPEFSQYYPSVNDLNRKQKKFYRFWLKKWNKRKPVSADTSYIFIYIYKILGKAISDKSSLNSFVKELDALAQCYEGQVDSHINIWVADLFEYHGFYKSALERISSQDQKVLVNRILNLKAELNIPANGEDLITLGEYCGVNKYKDTKENFSKAVELGNEKLKNFKKDKGKRLLEYIKLKYSHEKRHDKSLLGGTVQSLKSPLKYFNFSQISLVVDFAIKSLHNINLSLKNKNQKKEVDFSKYEIPKSAERKLWKTEIQQPFRNPNSKNKSESCSHEWIVLDNHWETYRKYSCIECNKNFMCECDKELAEAIKPHQVRGEWLDSICRSCKGLDDTSPVTEGKLMYGSTFYAQHWREIRKEKDKILLKKAREKDISLQNAYLEIDIEDNLAENKVRERYDVPLVGEGWVSETTLYKNLEDIFSEYKVIHHASPDWLGRMHLDVFIPDLDLAFEYQGRQHFEPIDYFGGEEAFKKVKKRDKKKARLCEKNNIDLIYITKDNDFSKSGLKKILDDYLDNN